MHLASAPAWLCRPPPLRARWPPDKPRSKPHLNHPLCEPGRKLAVIWHPDKHLSDPEEAKAKFQAISAAYNSLMASSEDDKVEQLEGKA